MLTVYVPFPYGVWGRLWDSIVSVPDHYFSSTLVELKLLLYDSVWFSSWLPYKTLTILRSGILAPCIIKMEILNRLVIKHSEVASVEFTHLLYLQYSLQCVL